MSETIGEFLVTLGYKIDKQSESKFTDAIAGATRLVVALGAAFVAASGTVALGVVSISRDLDQIYFQSQRTGASAANIKAFAYAMTQLGISESEASQNLEGFAHAQRMMGGSFTSVMSELNIATKDAKGNSRDTIEIMADFGKSLGNLNQAAAIAYGAQFGLTESFVISSKKGGEQFTKDFRDLYAKHKVDLNQGAKDSNAFWTQMRSLGATLGVLGAAIETNLIEMFGRGAKSFSELVEKNMPAIAATLTKLCEALIELGVALAPVVWGIIGLTPKVVSFFKEVDKGLRSLIGDNSWATGLELTAVSLVLLAGPTGLLFKLLGFLTRIVAITLPGWLLGALGISAAGGGDCRYNWWRGDSRRVFT